MMKPRSDNSQQQYIANKSKRNSTAPLKSTKKPPVRQSQRLIESSRNIHHVEKNVQEALRLLYDISISSSTQNERVILVAQLTQQLDLNQSQQYHDILGLKEDLPIPNQEENPPDDSTEDGNSNDETAH